MDKLLQEYYEARFEMMAGTGWSDFVDDVQKMYDARNHVLGVQSEQDLFFKKGQLDVLQWVLTLKQSSEEVFEQLKSGDSADGSTNI
jgi:hypothetical protein